MGIFTGAGIADGMLPAQDIINKMGADNQEKNAAMIMEKT